MTKQHFQFSCCLTVLWLPRTERGAARAFHSNLCRLFASLLVASPAQTDWPPLVVLLPSGEHSSLYTSVSSLLLSSCPRNAREEEGKWGRGQCCWLSVQALSCGCQCDGTLISEETHHHLHHLLRPLLLPPPLRCRGLLLLQGFLQARHREVLLLCGGDGRLQYWLDLQTLLPVVQVWQVSISRSSTKIIWEKDKNSWKTNFSKPVPF